LSKSMVEQTGGIPNFEGGEVLLWTGDVMVLKVALSSTRINVDLQDKAFVKRLIAMREQLTPKLPGAAEEGNPPQIVGALSTARKAAEELSSRGVTVMVSYRGRRIATIGAEAHSALLQAVTKTRHIALNSVVAAIRLVI
jgi:hypothetical protein